MGTLTINGRKVKVDDSFGSLSPEQQQQTVNEIAASMGGPSPEFQGAMERGSQASAGLKGNVADLPSKRPTLGDELLSAGRGVIEGIPVLGPALSDARRGLDANIMSMLHGGEAGQYQEQFKASDEALREKTGGARFAGNVAGAVGALAPLGATALGGRLLGVTGSLPARIATGAASSAAISGADTLARGGSPTDALTSGGIGAVIGGALPVIGAGVRRAISPLPANAAKTRAAQVLQREGVDLTAGQRTGSKGMQYAEAELGGNAAQNFAERQADQFTAAALRRVGVQADRATPDVIDAGFRDIGRMFDDLAVRNGLQTDARFVQDLNRAWREFESVTNPSSRPAYVERLLNDLSQQLQTGYAFLPGDWFKSTRSELARLARGSSNPEFAGALRDIMGAMDDAMERTLQQTNPADAGAWRQARRLYANMLVVEDAATRAGEKAADGIITPQALRSAAMKQNKRAFARGRNEFTDLANAGVSTMTPLPQSGTAPRAAVQAAKAMLPFIGGALGGGGTLGLGAVAGAAAGAAAPWLAGRAMLSGPGRAYLGNQVAANLPLLPVAPAVPALTATRR